MSDPTERDRTDALHSFGEYVTLCKFIPTDVERLAQALAAARQEQREADARIADQAKGWTPTEIAQAIRQGGGA